MDREILFRGKPKDKDCQMFKNLQIHMQDGFIYGFLIAVDYTCYICTSAIKSNKSYINNGIVTMVEVSPETVGQYTGLTDKKGNKIFEGDIVKYGDTVHNVVFEQRNGTAYFGLVYSTLETLSFGHYQDLKQIEVIGNIHDNSDLLEVSE